MPDEDELMARFLKLKQSTQVVNTDHNALIDNDLVKRVESINGRPSVISSTPIPSVTSKNKDMTSSTLRNDLNALKSEFQSAHSYMVKEGTSNQSSTSPKAVFENDDEEIAKLLEQITHEVVLDTQLGDVSALNDDDLKGRIDELLKGTKSLLGPKYAMRPDEYEKIAAANPDKRLQEKVKPPMKCGTCCICLEAAYCWCPKCDNDKYCFSCWDGCHEKTNPEMSTHKYKTNS
jgi:hypothetical protein